MHSSRRSHDERASSLRSMSDRGKDAAVAIAARSQMLISTTVSFVPVSSAGMFRINDDLDTRE